MTCLIHRESKTPFNYLGKSGSPSKITPDSEEVIENNYELMSRCWEGEGRAANCRLASILSSQIRDQRVILKILNYWVGNSKFKTQNK